MTNITLSLQEGFNFNIVPTSVKVVRQDDRIVIKPADNVRFKCVPIVAPAGENATITSAKWFDDNNKELEGGEEGTYTKNITNIDDVKEAIKCSATVKSITEVEGIESTPSSDYPRRM